jgi:hypothetical protein
MRILHLDQVEVLLPIGTLLFERSRAVADLNPAGCSVRAKPRFPHVSQVLGASDGTFAESSLFNRLEKGRLAAWLDTRAYQIPHIPILCAANGRRDVPRSARGPVSGVLEVGVAVHGTKVL